MMKWPPNKCWNSPVTTNGNRHYQVKSFGGKGKNRWVELFAAKDKKIIQRLSWEEIKGSWHNTWLILPKEDSFKGFSDN